MDCTVHKNGIHAAGVTWSTQIRLGEQLAHSCAVGHTSKVCEITRTGPAKATTDRIRNAVILQQADLKLVVFV